MFSHWGAILKKEVNRIITILFWGNKSAARWHETLRLMLIDFASTEKVKY